MNTTATAGLPTLPARVDADRQRLVELDTSVQRLLTANAVLVHQLDRANRSVTNLRAENARLENELKRADMLIG